MATKKPYYPWFASDFLGSQFVQSLTPIEELCYRRLLDMQATALDRRISSDPQVLRLQCRNLRNAEWLKIWAKLGSKFTPHPDGGGGLVNLRQYEVLLKVDELDQAQSNKGKLGAEARWKAQKNDASGNGTGNAQAMPGQSLTDSRSMASNSNSKTIPKSPLINPQSLINPSVPIQAEAGRTNGHEKPDFGKFWGPIEKQLRGDMVEEYFQKWFQGTRILDMTSRSVVVAVPEQFLQDFENIETATQALLARIEKAGTGLMRGRGLKLVSLESVTEAPVVSVGEKA